MSRRLRVRSVLVGWILLAGMLAGGELTGWALAAGQTAGAQKLDDFVGRYRPADEPDQVRAVRVENGVLGVEGERRARMELQPEGTDRYASVKDGQGGQVVVAFERDASGRVTGMVYTSPAAAEPLHLARFETTDAPLNHFRAYSRQVVMMPMRDGAKLHAVIFRPAGSETD